MRREYLRIPNASGRLGAKPPQLAPPAGNLGAKIPKRDFPISLHRTREPWPPSPQFQYRYPLSAQKTSHPHSEFPCNFLFYSPLDILVILLFSFPSTHIFEFGVHRRKKTFCMLDRPIIICGLLILLEVGRGGWRYCIEMLPIIIRSNTTSKVILFLYMYILFFV